MRSLLSASLVGEAIDGIFERLRFDRVGFRCEGALFTASREAPSQAHGEVQRLWRVGALLATIARAAGAEGAADAEVVRR